MISIIAAMDEKRGIGKDNRLLFKIPADFERMKKLTMGHPIIMGRKTFDSIGRVLPGRTNIVVSRNPESISSLDVNVSGSLEEALQQAQGKPGSEEIFIFGGGQIFQEALEKGLVDKLYLTVVEGDFGADTFFPEYSGFKIIKEEAREEEEYKFKFQELKKN